MNLVHVELREANAFVEQHHRHHRRVQGHRFSIGAKQDGLLVGVAIVGRPVGGTHQGDWCEVTRLCTDGTKNVCSFLYSGAARAGAALGFERIQTYILSDESGVSLKASGWTFDRMSHPVGWHHDGPRAARAVQGHLMDRKQLWYRTLGAPSAPAVIGGDTYGSRCGERTGKEAPMSQDRDRETTRETTTRPDGGTTERETTTEKPSEKKPESAPKS